MAPHPLEGLFAVNKPAGISSADVVRVVKNRFRKSESFKELGLLKAKGPKKKRSTTLHGLKVGHGGTLDPLASGILVIGLGSGTKKLHQLLTGSSKEYIATGLLGCSTDTHDRLGKIIKETPYAHVTRSKLEGALEKFRGDVLQMPPIFSALSINGKRLYQYARSGQPLPKPIEPRPMKVDVLELLEFTTDHKWEFPMEEAESDIKLVADYIQNGPKVGENTNPIPQDVKRKIIQGIEEPGACESTFSKEPEEPPAKKQKTSVEALTPDLPLPDSPAKPDPSTLPTANPAVFKLLIRCTSGFYVRSLIRDIGEALNSSAHMVALERTRQGKFSIDDNNTLEFETINKGTQEDWEPPLVKAMAASLIDYPDRAGKTKRKKGENQAVKDVKQHEDENLDEQEDIDEDEDEDVDENDEDIVHRTKHSFSGASAS